MSSAERIQNWNQRYEQVPAEWRSQIVVWPVLLVGAINLALTIAIRFPFGLLLLLAIMAIAAIRVPYVIGWIEASSPEGPHRFQIKNADWIHHVNVSYDSLAEMQRFWVLPIVLVTAGTINMALTIAYGFTFGVLFLLALLALVAIRAPYVHGMIPQPGGAPRLATAGTPAIHNVASVQPVITHVQSIAPMHTSGHTSGPAPMHVPEQAPEHAMMPEPMPAAPAIAVHDPQA